MVTEARTGEGRSGFDRLIVGAMGLTLLGSLIWFLGALSSGLLQPSEDLDGPSTFRAYGCSSCHVRGPVASGRGPALGDFATVAGARAAERGRSLGAAMTAADYAVESLVEPDAYLVEGYPAGVMRATRMKAPQLMRLVAFLLGRPEDDRAVRAAVVRRLPSAEAEAPEAAGDVERGRALFHERAGPASCVTCHAVTSGADEGLGPSLSDAGVYSAEQLRASILDPSAVILPRHRSFVVTDGDRSWEGAVRVESTPTEAGPGVLSVTRREGVERLSWRALEVCGGLVTPDSTAIHGHGAGLSRLPSAIIDGLAEREGAFGIQPSAVSLMPSYRGVLDERQLEDLVRYLSSLKPGEPR